MISCIHEYTNDPVSVDPANPDEHSSSLYMYEKMMAEGHDPRMFRFSPETSGHNGGHSPPQNYEYWRVGCLGVTPSCSKVQYFRIDYEFVNIKYTQFGNFVLNFSNAKPHFWNV